MSNREHTYGAAQKHVASILQRVSFDPDWDSMADKIFDGVLEDIKDDLSADLELQDDCDEACVDICVTDEVRCKTIKAATPLSDMLILFYENHGADAIAALGRSIAIFQKHIEEPEA